MRLTKPQDNALLLRLREGDYPAAGEQLGASAKMIEALLARDAEIDALRAAIVDLVAALPADVLKPARRKALTDALDAAAAARVAIPADGLAVLDAVRATKTKFPKGGKK